MQPKYNVGDRLTDSVDKACVFIVKTVELCDNGVSQFFGYQGEYHHKNRLSYSNVGNEFVTPENRLTK
jgi:hypothetical protein